MGKKGGSVPQPEPVSQTVAAQKDANKDAIETSARINAVDIYSPYGSTTYTKDATGIPTAQTTTLNPDSQYIYDKQLDIGKTMADTAYGRLNGISSTPYTMAGMPYDPRAVNTGTMPMFDYSTIGRGYAGGVGGQSPVSPHAAVGPAGWSGAFGIQGGQPSSSGGQAPTGTQIAGGSGTGSVAGSAGGDNLSPGVMPYDPRSYGNMEYFNNDVGNAIFDQGMSRLDPRIADERRRFDQQMADRGIPIGSEAYNRAASEMSRNQNDLVTSLANQATYGALDATKGIVGLEQGLRGTAWNENLQGSQQQQKDWLTKLQTEQNIRDTVNRETLGERNQAINEVAAILQGSPALGMPNAPQVPTYQMASPDVIGATNANFNQQMSAYNAQQAANNSMWQGAFGLGKALLPFAFSHPALKEVLGDA